jgi:hypothetical protein
MAALPIIKQFDVVKQRGACLVTIKKALMEEPFVFNVLKKLSTTALS